MKEKEDELIKKLEDTELPEVELTSHRRRLKMALLEPGYLRGRQGVTVSERVKNRIKGGIGTMVGIFASRQPIWKTGLIGILALAIVVSLVVAIPPLFRQDDKALAAEIALNSPKVINALNNDPVETVRVTESAGDIFTVEVTGINGTHLDVTVDLSTKTVMEVLVSPAQNFTDDEVEKVILILQSDDTIKALLKQGAIIQSMANYSLRMEPAKLGEGTGEIIEKKVHVTIALGDKLYLADIELISGQLLGFGDYATMKTVPFSQP